MTYLAKSTVLKAYQLLSNIDTDKRQGLTQKVSALKYASALDIYFKKHNQNCDLKQSSNKDLFSSYVGEIVKINDEYCTKDFFFSVSSNGRDFDCGSNFFSQTSVKDSKTNPNTTFLYPKRSGWQPVMDVHNQELIYRSDYLLDVFSFYLGSSELRLAFIIWVLRFVKITEDTVDGIISALNKIFTIDYCDALYTDSVKLVDTSYIEFDDEMCQLSCEDIQSLFNLEKGHSHEESFSVNLPLQQIFYGAPGTGKSHIINEFTEVESVIRTTFHPDSDYSTFVGAYKPTTKEVTLRDLSGHPVKENGVTLTEDRIIYEFVDQAFLQAYIQAWKYYAEADESSEPQKQYLIIEEINRGNCAQIFGDLFQLLDRNYSGFSGYPINADNDMKKQLAKAFKGLSIAQADSINNCYKGKDITSKVLSGEILLLPNNLYIWATMNTSDQSLFPIDSAFKRRWDWKYMPICKGRDENGNELNWKIIADTTEYDWWSFLTEINKHIHAMTNSEDKKLGFFFCKPYDGCISSETFVGKVIFYLWNDVFKDYGLPKEILDGADSKEFAFCNFINVDGSANEEMVKRLLDNLGVAKGREISTEKIVPTEDIENNTVGGKRDTSRYKVNGSGNYPKTDLATEVMRIYVNNNPGKSVNDIISEWTGLNVAITDIVTDETVHEFKKSKTSDPRFDNRTGKVSIGTDAIFVTRCWSIENVSDFIAKVNAKPWGIRIENV